MVKHAQFGVGLQPSQQFAGSIGGTIVYHNDLIGQLRRLHSPDDFLNGLSFVIHGDKDGYSHAEIIPAGEKLGKPAS
jgi:hypothetical protein